MQVVTEAHAFDNMLTFIWPNLRPADTHAYKSGHSNCHVLEVSRTLPRICIPLVSGIQLKRHFEHMELEMKGLDVPAVKSDNGPI